MKKMHAKRSWIFFMVLALVLVLGKTPVFAATVNDFAGLKQAITDGEASITINGDITVTKTLEIKKDVTISGGSLKWAPADRSDQKGDQMFKVNEGKTLALKDITLDGDNQGRLINVKGGTVQLENAILQNGSTEPLKQNANKDQNFSGGAILATKGEKQGSTVIIKGGAFKDNNTGSTPMDGNRAAEGGAIKIEDSILKINDAKTTKKDATIFSGNHLDGWETTGGRQGGSIEATRSKVEIYGATFDVPGPFNTGGAIKFENCGKKDEQAKVINSSFTILDGKKPVGMAGGAITSEGSNLTIDNSTFNTGNGSYVQESGGLIQVVGKGEFHLTNSTLTGSGVGWNQTGANKTAKFGGAIVFYDDSTVKATIENTTIQNFTAEISGGGIALNTQIGKGKKSAVNLTLIDTKILNNVTYDFGMQAYGGGMFVGQNNTVEMQGGEISSTVYSGVGGAIYNEGKLTLTGTAENPAKIINNKAYHMAGGVLNDGELTVDYATFSGNVKGDWSTGNGHVYDKNTDKDKRELSGVNIYAVKDVTITPNAHFDNKDVRILDGQSSIILTGALPDDRHINVSISETPKKQGENTVNKPEYPLHPKFNETQNRKVGYLIAKGDGNYTPSASDAKVLNYVSNDTSQDVASADEHTSIGEWDFVLNPKTKQVVLGQRVKVTLHANGTDEAKAKFEGVKEERDDDKGIETKLVPDNQKQDVYDIYISGEKSAELTPEPIRKGYAFTGWYEQDFVNDDAPDKGKDGKTLVDELKLVKDANEITTIIYPHEYTLYAGWEKVIPVEKIWDDNNDEFKNRPDSVIVKLFLNGRDLNNSVRLNAENHWKGEFKNLPESEEDILQYSVKEDPEQIKGYEEGVVTGNNQEGFTVTNSTEFITIKGKKTWVHDGNEGTKPGNVTVTLNENGKATDQTKTGSSWKFENLPKYKNKQEVNYTLTEAPVPNYTSSADGYNFTNTYEKKYKVSYEFVSGTAGKTLPDEVMALLPQEETGKEDGVMVTPTAPTSTTVDTADGTWTFKGWNPAETTISGADVSFKGTWTFTEKSSDFTVTKAVDKATFEKAGDVLTYTVTVKNTGEKKLENLTISDSLVALNEDPFALEVGGEKTFTYTYTVTEADVKAKAVNNMATVTHDNNAKSASAESKLKEDKPNPPTKVITQYVDEKGNRLIPDRAGKQPVVEIKDYTYLRTEESDTLIRHIYKKIQAPTHPSGSVLILPTPGTSEPVPDDGLLNKKDHKAYMFGYPDGNFLPERNMTREEATAMFARLLKDYPRERRNYTIPFNDVAESDWSQQAIGFMLEKGMIKGYEDGSFRPKAAISRAEFAAMAARFDKLVAGGGNSFFDVPAGHWAQGAIDSAAAKGWVTGYPDGSFKPERKITRAEVVNITNKMLDRFADKDFVRSHLSEMIQFKDLTEADWAYFPIMEATNGHDYTRKAAQEENWIRLNGEEFRFVVVGRK